MRKGYIITEKTKESMNSVGHILMPGLEISGL
jgi:hypothetical protein